MLIALFQGLCQALFLAGPDARHAKALKEYKNAIKAMARQPILRKKPIEDDYRDVSVVRIKQDGLFMDLGDTDRPIVSPIETSLIKLKRDIGTLSNILTIGGRQICNDGPILSVCNGVEDTRFIVTEVAGGFTISTDPETDKTVPYKRRCMERINYQVDFPLCVGKKASQLWSVELLFAEPPLVSLLENAKSPAPVMPDLFHA